MGQQEGKTQKDMVRKLVKKEQRQEQKAVYESVYGYKRNRDGLQGWDDEKETLYYFLLGFFVFCLHFTQGCLPQKRMGDG